jgi:hypothetical protein
MSNRKITVFMNPHKATKALPELGYVFPCGKARTLVVSEEDAQEFKRRSERMVPVDSRSAEKREHRRYDVTLGAVTEEAAEKKIPQRGWVTETIPKNPLIVQTDALKDMLAQLVQSTQAQTDAVTKLLTQKR